jgi:hypothetical protein
LKNPDSWKRRALILLPWALNSLPPDLDFLPMDLEILPFALEILPCDLVESCVSRETTISPLLTHGGTSDAANDADRAARDKAKLRVIDEEPIGRGPKAFGLRP